MTDSCVGLMVTTTAPPGFPTVAGIARTRGNDTGHQCRLGHRVNLEPTGSIGPADGCDDTGQRWCRLRHGLTTGSSRRAAGGPRRRSRQLRGVNGSNLRRHRQLPPQTARPHATCPGSARPPNRIQSARRSTSSASTVPKNGTGALLRPLQRPQQPRRRARRLGRGPPHPAPSSSRRQFRCMGPRRDRIRQPPQDQDLRDDPAPVLHSPASAWRTPASAARRAAARQSGGASAGGGGSAANVASSRSGLRRYGGIISRMTSAVIPLVISDMMGDLWLKLI